MGQVVTIGLDLAKSVFQVHGVDAAGEVVGTIKAWMDSTHFLMKRLRNVKTEISLHILAYNLKRVMQILGAKPLIAAMQT